MAWSHLQYCILALHCIGVFGELCLQVAHHRMQRACTWIGMYRAVPCIGEYKHGPRPLRKEKFGFLPA